MDYAASNQDLYSMTATTNNINDPAWFQSFEDTEWFHDSGATNHITSEMENLTTVSEFYGTDLVHMGDGKGLSTAHKALQLFIWKTSQSSFSKLYNCFH